MMIRACFRTLLLLLLPLLAGTALPALAADDEAPPPAKPSAFQDLAAKYKELLTVPTFEQSPAEIDQSVKDTLAAAEAALDKIGKQDLGGVAFATTVGALDDATYPVSNLGSRLNLIQQTSPDAAVRQAAEEAVKKVQEWSVALDYREDVYKAITAYAKTEPKLEGEEARLLEFTVRDYRRAGLGLSADDRKEVERMRKELAAMTTDFAVNISNSLVPVTFTRAELDGVPATFLDDPKVKTGDDQYTVMANQAFQYILVEENTRSVDARKKLYVAHDNLAREKNVPLFNKMLALRNDLALKLGYKSWADYQTEVKMARTGAEAERFIDELIEGTGPKFGAEVRQMAKLLPPAPDDQPDLVPTTWDWHFLQNQILKTRYTVDTEALRAFFPFQKVLDGMFRVYEHDFGLKFTPLEAPYKWVPDLQLYVASDAASGEPLGLFYLDMFPREGKYNHFAEFGVVDGKLLPDGNYQRPVVCLVCNFPPPSKDKPSLMSHDDVVTIFHEFGHALHAMVTRAKFGRFAGTNVPGDFVEAPSQMLENWAWDKTVLDSFAADYRDPAKKIPAETLDKMKEAKLAFAGTHYRRQFAFAKLDLVLHGPHRAGKPYDCVGVTNILLRKVFLPLDLDTAMIAGFGHLADGYDAGYYGYAWADAISADLATVFRQSPGGFMDAGVGMQLRKEIYEPGGSRDVSESIEKFLGRKRSIAPFLANNLGLAPTDPHEAGGGTEGASPNVK